MSSTNSKVDGFFTLDRNIDLLLAHILSFATLSLVAFHLNAPVAFFRFDGIFLLTSVVNQERWMAPFGTFSMNPLEGNAGLWFPTAMHLIPGFAIGSLFGNSWLPTISFTWFATEFFVTTLILGRSIGIPWRTSAVGAWILALGLFPYTVPTPMSERIWGNPHLLTAISANALALATFVSVSGKSLKGDLLRLLFTLLLLAYIGFSQPIAAVLAWPVFGFFACISIFGTDSCLARKHKLFGLVVITALVLLLFSHYLFGLFAYAKTTFFWNELTSMTLSWRQQSFLLDYGSEFRWLGTLVLVVAIFGGVIHTRTGSRSQRVFAFGLIGFFVVIMSLCLVVSLLNHAWRGPVPAYLDLFVFPYYAIFFGIGIKFFIVRWHLLGKLPRWAFVVLPWFVLAGWKAPYDKTLFKNHVPFGWPPQPTSIVETLRREIGLNDVFQFRGRVANIAGTQFSPELTLIPFASQHNYDALTAFFSGNDQRMFGLWYFGIPTLIEGSQFSSPFFHLLTSRLLAEPGIQHTRPQTTITRFDERIFRLLGVRFVISDQLQPGANLVKSASITEGRPQYLYEISHPNVSGKIATRLLLVKNPQEAIEKLSNSKVDLDATAIVLQDVAGDTHLAPGTTGRLLFFRDRAEISASSEGTSLLVLPVEYSKCIKSNLHDQSASGMPTLLRVNLSQLGILFTGKLSGTFDFHFSPLIRSDCRYRDFMDAKELLRQDNSR